MPGNKNLEPTINYKLHIPIMKLMITLLFASSLTMLSAADGCQKGKKKGGCSKKGEPTMTFNDCDKGKKNGGGCKKKGAEVTFNDCDKDKCKKGDKNKKPA